jgi:hypothetical protein
VPEDWIITDEGPFLRFDFVGRFSIDSGKACVDAMVDACVKITVRVFCWIAGR